MLDADSFSVFIVAAALGFATATTTGEAGESKAGYHQDCNHYRGNKVELVGRFSPTI